MVGTAAFVVWMANGHADPESRLGLHESAGRAAAWIDAARERVEAGLGVHAPSPEPEATRAPGRLPLLEEEAADPGRVQPAPRVVTPPAPFMVDSDTPAPSANPPGPAFSPPQLDSAEEDEPLFAAAPGAGVRSERISRAETERIRSRLDRVMALARGDRP